jgi:hypothetical protein
MSKQIPVFRTGPGARDLAAFENGQMRPLSVGELGNLAPARVMNEMGVEFSERWKLKNFAKNPEQMKLALEAMGYHVMPYGGGFNFAVQRGIIDPDTGEAAPPDPDSWRVVDPSGFNDPKEIMYDFLDLTADIGSGFLATLGAVGGGIATGGLGAVAGAAAGGAAGELARQGIGEAIGFENNIDVGQAATVGAFTGAFEGAGGLVAAGARKIAPALKEIGLGLPARLIGLSKSGDMTPGIQLDEMARLARSKLTVPTRATIASAGKRGGLELGRGQTLRPLDAVNAFRAAADETTHVFRKVMDENMMSGFRELRLAGQIVAQNARRGVRAQTSKAWQALNEVIDNPSIIAEMGPANFRKTQQLLNTLGARLGGGSAARIKTLKSLRVDQAWGLKQELDEFLRSIGAFKADPSNIRLKPFMASVKNAADELREALRVALPKRYEQLMKTTKDKFTVLGKLRPKLGEGKEGAENFVNNFLRTGGTEARQTVQQFDRLFGSNFDEVFSATAVAEKFGPGGQLSIIPKLAATGQFVTISALGGGGLVAGGPFGAAIGLGVGLLSASPRGIVTGINRIARPGLAAGAAGARAGRAAGRLAAPGVSVRLSSDKPVARQDGSPPRGRSERRLRF